jgi:hypothetical protein
MGGKGKDFEGYEMPMGANSLGRGEPWSRDANTLS